MKLKNLAAKPVTAMLLIAAALIGGAGTAVAQQSFPADGFVVLSNDGGPAWAMVDDRLMICRGRIDVKTAKPACIPSPKLPAGGAREFVTPARYLEETVGQRAGGKDTVEYVGMSIQNWPTSIVVGPRAVVLYYRLTRSK